MRDYFGGAIFFLVGALIGLGCYFIYSEINSESVLVVLSDDTECRVRDYAIVLDEKTISVETNQIRSDLYKDRFLNEAYLSFIGNTDEGGRINYRVRATYHDCVELVGPQNSVEPGWTIYESIKNRKVGHDVRAK